MQDAIAVLDKSGVAWLNNWSACIDLAANSALCQRVNSDLELGLEPALWEMPTLPELAARCNTDCFSNLCDKYGSSNTALGASLLDISARFHQWSNSIGAAKPGNVSTSLEYRLRAASKLHGLLQTRLLNLQEDLNDLIVALSELPSERLGEIHYPISTPSAAIDTSTEPDSIVDINPDPIADIGELLKASSEDVSALFKLSIAARRSTTRDRYAQALARISPDDVLSEDAEIAAVGNQFPTLRFADLQWLRLRMAKANNIRRRYLEYCRQHASAIARDNELAESSNLQQSTSHSPAADSGLEPPETVDTEDADQATIGYQTTALTARGTMFELNERTPERSTYDDAESTYSYFTQSHSEATLQVPLLETVNSGPDTFICPYCHTEQAITSEAGWKKHVFADLKAYTCIHQSCELRMFENSHAWLTHELLEHFVTPRCPYCDGFDATDNGETLSKHLTKTHGGRFELEQLPRLLQASNVVPDEIPARACPLCDWTAKLQYSDSSRSVESRRIVVSSQRYRRHIGAHLEQIALATIVSIPEEGVEEPYQSDQDSSDEEAAGEEGAFTWSHAKTLRGDNAWVNAVAFSPDGSLVASASDDHIIRVWKTATGSASLTLRGHKDSVCKVVFLPGGMLLASADHFGNVKLWDVATATETWRISVPSWYSITFSPDGQLYAASELSGSVSFWNVTERAALGILSVHASPVSGMAFSRDGRRMASKEENDNRIRLSSVIRPEGAATVQMKFDRDLEVEGRGLRPSAWSLCFSPDSKVLAATVLSPPTILLWETGSGKEVQQMLGHDGEILNLAFSPDGNFIASASDDCTVRIWVCETGRELQRLDGHSRTVSAIAWSSDGRFIASASDDSSVRLWKARKVRKVSSATLSEPHRMHRAALLAELSTEDTPRKSFIARAFANRGRK